MSSTRSPTPGVDAVHGHEHAVLAGWPSGSSGRTASSAGRRRPGAARRDHSADDRPIFTAPPLRARRPRARRGDRGRALVRELLDVADDGGVDRHEALVQRVGRLASVADVHDVARPEPTTSQATTLSPHGLAGLVERHHEQQLLAAQPAVRRVATTRPMTRPEVHQSSRPARCPAPRGLPSGRRAGPRRPRSR
jgi:hypothetical protein